VPTEVLAVTGLCALVLVDSTLHVRSLIRQRRDARAARLSRAVSLAGLAAAAGLGTAVGMMPAGWWLPAGYAVLVVRAFAVRTTRPARIGLAELGAFAAVAVTAGLAT
jgi:hypothetical protein